ncbi:hypothetical protein EMMF5_006355 [Cystobasidiomycetes sp. EMM_F5]
MYNWSYTVTDKNSVLNTPLNISKDPPAPTSHDPQVSFGQAEDLRSAGWITVKTGEIGHFVRDGNPGIMTTGQFQCICIIVTKLVNGQVDEAWLLHVSSSKSGKVSDMANLIKESGEDIAYVAIVSGRTSMANGIAEVVAKLRAMNPTGVIVYTGEIKDGLGNYFGFGLSANGNVAQVEGK